MQPSINSLLRDLKQLNTFNDMSYTCMLSLWLVIQQKADDALSV